MAREDAITDSVTFRHHDYVFEGKINESDVATWFLMHSGLFIRACHRKHSRLVPATFCLQGQTHQLVLLIRHMQFFFQRYGGLTSLAN